jgi:hypothetical protein
MPGLDGIEATRQLAGPGVAAPLAVVVITNFDLDEYVYAALRAGARGFLLKDAGPGLLTQAVHAAARGDALIAPSITARLLHAFAATAPPSAPAQPAKPGTKKNNGHGQGDRTSMRNWQALVLGHSLARGNPAGQDLGASPCPEDARSASVSNATSAWSCTSAGGEASWSDPSSARAASPALLSMSSAIRVSMV